MTSKIRDDSLQRLKSVMYGDQPLRRESNPPLQQEEPDFNSFQDFEDDGIQYPRAPTSKRELLKKNFFNMFEQVLGGQSSSSQIAQSMSAFQNSLNQFQNSGFGFDAPQTGILRSNNNSVSPQRSLSNTRMKKPLFVRPTNLPSAADFTVSPTLAKAPRLNEEDGIKSLFGQQQVAPGSTIVGQNISNFNVNMQMDPSMFTPKFEKGSIDFPGNLLQAGLEDDCESLKREEGSCALKKRSRKQYTKRAKKTDETENEQSFEKSKDPSKNSVSFAREVDVLGDEGNEATVVNGIDVTKLTSKKKQYLVDSIADKNGTYNYLQDPVEYKKARKRLQNRESAVRSRQRKKTYQEELEGQIAYQNEIIDALQQERDQLFTSHQKLSSENEQLRAQVTYFEESFAKSNLIGGSNVPTESKVPSTLMGSEVIHRSELDQFKLDILEKINRRFLDFDQKPENVPSKPVSTELPSAAKNAMMAPSAKGESLKKRERINSGQIQFKESTYSEHSTTSAAAEDSAEQVLTLKREQGDFKSKGCMLLAVVFGMMCCSSYLGGSLPESQVTSQVEQIPVSSNVRDLKSVKNESDIISSMTHMTLQSSSVDDEMVEEDPEEVQTRSLSLREIARSMKNLGKVDLSKIMQGPHSVLLRQIVAGEYNYLAYLMCSAVCCYYWMSPSQQTLRLVRGRGRQEIKISQSGEVSISNEDVAMRYTS